MHLGTIFEARILQLDPTFDSPDIPSWARDSGLGDSEMERPTFFERGGGDVGC